MTENITTLLSTGGAIGLMIMLWVVAQISRRFGEVTHRPPLYRFFYVALALLVLPLVVRLLAVGQADRAGTDALAWLLHDIPLALGLTLALGTAWQYWGWLVYAHEGQSPARRPARPPRRADRPDSEQN